MLIPPRSMGKVTVQQDAPVSNEDEQDVIDLDHQYALLTAKIRGDALARMACAAGMNNVFDCPEPMDHKEAMTTPDAE